MTFRIHCEMMNCTILDCKQFLVKPEKVYKQHPVYSSSPNIHGKFKTNLVTNEFIRNSSVQPLTTKSPHSTVHIAT
jgi:hypothetical protein